MKKLNGKIQIRYCEKKYIDLIDINEIDTVFECGSRDGLDAIRIDMVYAPKNIYVFEPNPEGAKQCRDNLQTYGKDHIKFFDVAVSNTDGIVDFYPSTEENIGASSMFEYNSRANGWDGYKTNCFKSTQKDKISVTSIRIDTFMKENNIDSIDLLCMDVQEAELLVLEGMGEHLNNVKYIILEVSGEGYYHNGARYDDIKNLLHSRGFKLVDLDKNAISRFGNAMFVLERENTGQ
tara:strand:+ start:3413 stop:4117 length:705 start_codon:yes stop_codon:yes gene_type:complete